MNRNFFNLLRPNGVSLINKMKNKKRKIPYYYNNIFIHEETYILLYIFFYNKKYIYK